jgi:hypothetical protein
MSQHQQNREDLLREATALVERVELKVPGLAENVVMGFRRGGGASVFFGDDPVFQFNAAGELRRAYRVGRLIKAEHGKLIELQRRRTATDVQLVRRELNENGTRELLEEGKRLLEKLRQRLAAGEFELVGCVPENVNVAARVLSWLSSLDAQIRIAARPNVS